MFLKPLGMLFGLLGSFLERLGAKLGWFGATFGTLQCLMISWSDFRSKKGTQREAFWEAKWSKNRSKIEVQIQERNSNLLESSWIDFGSIFKPSWDQQ